MYENLSLDNVTENLACETSCVFTHFHLSTYLELPFKVHVCHMLPADCKVILQVGLAP